MAPGDLRPAGLELGLDQEHERCAGRGDGEQRRQHGGQGDERQVGHHQVDRAADRFLRQVAHVAALADVDARVVPHGGMELAVAHVDGHHLRRAPLQEAVGEAPGRGPGVQGPHVADVERRTARARRRASPRPARRSGPADRGARRGRRARPGGRACRRSTRRRSRGARRWPPARRCGSGRGPAGRARCPGGGGRSPRSHGGRPAGGRSAAGGLLGRRLLGRGLLGRASSWPVPAWRWSSWPAPSWRSSSWPSPSSPWSSWRSTSWPCVFLAVDAVAVRRGAGRRAATGRPDADAGGQLLDPGLEVGQVDTHRLELLADLALDEAHQVLGVLPTAGHQLLHGGLRLIDPELSGLLQVLRDLLGLGLGHLGEAQARVDEPLDEVVAGHLQQPTGIAPAVDDAGGAAHGRPAAEVSR